MAHELATLEADLTRDQPALRESVPSPISEAAPDRPARAGTAARVFFFCFLAVQLFLPSRGIGKSPPARVSWRMYSALSTYQNLVVQRADGSADTVAAVDYMLGHRQEIVWWPAMGEHLCRLFPDATAISPTRPDERMAAGPYTCP